MLKRASVIIPAFWLICTVIANAADMNFMPADEFKSMLDNHKPVVIGDIQKSLEFKKHYFYAAIETNAYPVKTDAEKRLLDKLVFMYEKSGNTIVIVGPRGGSPAKRAYRYLLKQNVPENKIYILEGGIKDWPYKEMLIDVAGGCA